MDDAERNRLRHAVEVARIASSQMQATASLLEAAANYMDPLLPSDEARALADKLANYVRDTVSLLAPPLRPTPTRPEPPA